MKLDYFRRWSDKRAEQLEPIQRKVQELYPDVAAQIFSTRTLKRIAMGEIPLTELRRWQQSVLHEAAEAIGFDWAEMALPDQA
jgi:hypothetical protein